MKNIRKIALLSAFGAAMLLAACGDEGTKSSSSTPSSSDNPSSVTSSSSSSSSKGSVVADLTNDDFPKGATEFLDANKTTQKLTRAKLYENAGDPHVNSYPTNNKKQKLLVAPIKFTKDSTDKNDTINADDKLLNQIKITFTGTAEETAAVGGNISVQEFYQRSSYGKGAFDVVMIPTWIDFGETAKSYQSSANVSAGVEAAERVRAWYIKEYAKDGHGALGTDASPIDEFDSDDDGYIDLIWNVYAYPYTSGDTSFWWAYVTYTTNAPAKEGEAPNVKTLAWASTNFMSEGSNGYESRTFIHETGHTLGLDDYYDYNKEWSPAGGIDYMDQNIGDHNSYSKFAYGWVNPWVIRESDLEGGKVADITLRLASSSGDCLVLASPNYNNTAFDEYFMVELVGPHGLCEKDYPLEGGFTEDGIRIWHVDARAVGSTDDYSKEEVFSTPDEVGQKAIDLRNDNSKFGRYKSGDFWTTDKGVKNSYSQLAIIEASWDSGQYAQNSSTYKASNSSLFQRNSKFNLKDKNGKKIASAFMPSQTNLWNKAKKITNASKLNQEQTIDETMTINYNLRVMDIKKDADYGAVATVRISLI